MQGSDLRAAAEAISPLLSTGDVPSSVLRTAASIYAKNGDQDKLQGVVTRLRGQTAGKAKPLADVEMFLGKLYESQGRYALALKAFEDSLSCE